MTVNTTNITSGPYAGNGVADTFSYTFRIQEKSQIRVFETDDNGVETELTVDTNFTVAGIGNDAGGTLTRTAGPLPTGYQWYIRSNYAETQDTAFSSQGAFFPDLHEDQMDHITFLIQQLRDSLGRSLTVSDSYSGSLPLSIDDPVANFLLRWKNDLTGLENIDPAQIITGNMVSSDFMKVTEDVTAMVADQTLLPGQLVITRGEPTIDDGEIKYFRIVTTADFMEIPDGVYDYTLANGNVAERIFPNTLSESARYQSLANGLIQEPNGDKFVVHGAQAFSYLFVTFETRTNYLYREIGIDPSKNESSGVSEPSYNAKVTYKNKANVRAELEKMKSNGVNLVRVGVEPAIMKASVAFTDPADSIQYPSDIRMLDNIINIAASMGMVIQLQNENFNVPDADNLLFLRWLKDKYWRTPNVWINPLNEPNGAGPDAGEVNNPVFWEAEMEQYMDALREDVTGQPAGTKWLGPICLDPPGWASRIDLIDTILQTNTSFSDDPNLIINIHYYPAATDTDWITSQLPTRKPQWVDFMGKYTVVIGEAGIDNVAGRLDPNLDPGTPSVDPTAWANVQLAVADFLKWCDEQDQYGNQVGASTLGNLNGVIGHMWFAYITGLSIHDDNSMYRQDGTITTWGTIYRDNYLLAKRNLLTGRRAFGADVNGQWPTGAIANDAVTNAKAGNMAQNTIKGRITAGTSDPEDLTSQQVLQIIANLASAGRVGEGSIGTPDLQYESTPGVKGAAMGIVNGVSEKYHGFYNRNTSLLTGSITGDGTTGVNYTSVSDHRLKDVKGELDDSEILDRLEHLRPVMASWKSDENAEEFLMFLAHEVAQAMPAAVDGKKDAETEKGEPIYQSVDYGRVTPLLAAGLKMALRRIEKLEELVHDKH